MNPSLARRYRFLGLATLFLAGCAAPPSTQLLETQVVFTPPASPVQVDAIGRVDVSTDMGTALLDYWLPNSMGIEPTRSNNYMTALARNLGRAVIGSNLFTQYDLDGSKRADFLVHVRFAYALVPNTSPDGRDIVVKLAFEVVDASTQKTIAVNSAEGATGVECVGRQGFRYKTNQFGSLAPYDAMIRGTVNLVNAMLPRLEAGAAAAIADYRQAPAREKALADLKTASLADLLVSSDPSVTMARERNRCIVAAKVGQLPGMLRSWSTEQLTNLVVKLEQTVLDLNHEAEVANDGAQRAAASEGNPGKIDALRGLAISYRERIELLKPILAALREEIANRSR